MRGLAWATRVLFIFVLFLALPVVVPSASLWGAHATGSVRHELVALRRANSDTFDNGDGTFTTKIFSSPVNFRVPSGDWNVIDSTLGAARDGTYAVRSRANSFHVRFMESLGPRFLALDLGGNTYALTLQNANLSRLAVAGARATYRDGLPGADLSYQVQSDRVEELVSLRGRDSATEFMFTLEAPAGVRLDVERLRDGSLSFSGGKSGNPLFSIPKPTVVGADRVTKRAGGAVSLTARRSGDGFVLMLKVDSAWLRAQRHFPVVIDPTLVIQRSTGTEEADVNYDALCAGCATSAPTRLSIGTTASQAWRAALQFDLAQIPSGANITAAQVQLYYDKACIGSTCPTVAQQFDVYRATKYWQSGDAKSSDMTYDSTAGPLASFTIPGAGTARWMSWDVTSTLTSWLHGDLPNYGVVVRRTDETLSTSGPMVPGGAYSAAPTLRPQLAVTYSGDGVDLVQPQTLHSNGAELSWSPYTGAGSTSFDNYSVYRSAVSNFTAGVSTLVATIRDPNITTYRDTTAAAAKTFTYKVTRNGTASQERTVTLPADGQATKILQPGPSDGFATTVMFVNNQTSCAVRGRYSRMWVGTNASSIRRALVRFDLHDLPPGSSVTDATVSLWQADVLRGAGTVSVHQLLSAWDEGTGINTCTGDGASWYDRQGSGVKWANAGGDFSAASLDAVTHAAGDQPGWNNWRITALLRQWLDGSAPNLGVLMKLDDETFSPCATTSNCNYWGYLADDYTVAPTLRPKLSVTYSDGSHAQGPTVSVAAPASGATASGVVNLAAGASDDGRVTNVDFLVDGTRVGGATAAPFGYAWTSSSVADGQHTATAVATDDAGNQTTSAVVSFSVDNSAAPATSVTAPVGGTTIGGTATVTAAASDDRSVSHVEFYVDGNRYTDTQNSPYTATLDTQGASDPVYDGTHQLTTKAYDGGGHITTSAPVSITVKNSPAGSIYGDSFASTEFPAVVTYDPSLSTQQSSGVAVTVTNTSTVSWGSSVSLRYRWLASDATPVAPDGVSVPLGTTVAPNASVMVNMLVPAPALPDGVERGRYTLRFDLFDSSTGTWFAAQGAQPLENPVLVNKALLRDGLGLERYYHYTGQDVGAGMQQLTNIANGNSILRWTPFDEDGRGLSTVLDLTYNSLENRCDCPAGNNWSLAISSLNRLGNPIDIHPNNADQIAGNANKYVEFADGDGTSHRFTDANNDGSWEAPAGVHLYLRPTGLTDPNKYWALTRPDRVTFYYDQNGYPQSVVDGNGNTLTFTESSVAPADDPGGPKFKVTKVTDAGGRSFTITYFTKTDAKKPQIRGKVKSITDHLGRELDFGYYLDGDLLRLTEKGGTNPDGALLADRSFVFTYTTSDGSGPAIPLAANRVNPDEKTSNQSTRVYSLRDPRGNETVFTYLGSGAGTNRWKLASITNRAGATTTYAYDTPNQVTTVTEPLNRVSKYTYDIEGKVTQITNPLSQQETVSWSVDRAVSKITEPIGVYKSYAYNDNGYLTSTTDQLGNQTQITYAKVPVDANDVAAKWEPGRTIPHISDIATKVDPKGVATPAIPNDYQWMFGHDTNGNVTSVTDPLGNATTNTFNPDGSLATSTDANGHVTSYASYDANGLPTAVVDPLGNSSGDTVNHRTTFSYNAAGELLSVQDAVHQAFGAATRTDASLFDYDAFGRMVRQSAPRSTSLEPGNLIWSSASFDPNDNVVSQTYPHYGPASADPGGDATTMAYDSMDRLGSQVVPHDPTSSDPVQKTHTTTYSYDAAGRLSAQTDPKGVLTTNTDKDFATFYAYDSLDRPTVQTRYLVDGTGTVTQTQAARACYDLAGDLRSTTTPKSEAGFPGCPAAALQYTALSGNYTTSYSYDADHRLLSTTDALGRTRSVTYDANGSPDTSTDENGTKSTRTYDQKGQVVKETEPFKSGTPTRDVVTQYQYDKVGNLAKMISPRAYDASADKVTFAQYVTSFDYDANDQRVRELLPTSTSDTQQLYVHHAFDAVGREMWTSLTTDQTLPANVAATEKSQFTYFDSGRVRTSKDPAEPQVSYDYSARGQQTSRMRALSTTDTGSYLTETQSYFSDGDLKDQHDAAGAPTTYTYDANDNVTGMTATGGVEVAAESPIVAQSTYDGFDQLVKLRQQKLGKLWHFTTASYDLNGNVMGSEDDATENADGTVTTGRKSDFTYNGADDIVDQVDHGLQSGCVDDQRVQYTYRLTGALQDEIVSRAGAGCTDTAPAWGVKQQTTDTYFLNRLLQTMKVWNGPAASGTLVQSHSLAYQDSAGVYLNGNQASDTFSVQGPTAGTPCQTSSCTTTYSYDAKDRLVNYDNARGGLTSYTLQPNGELASEAFSNAKGANVKTYTYNAANGVQLTALQRDVTPTGGTTTRTRQRFFYNHGDIFCVTHDLINADLTTGTQSSPGDCPASTGGTASSLLDQAYGYDSLDRLDGYHAYEAASETDSGSWTYDAVDRVSSETEIHKPSSANAVNVNRTMALDYLGLSNDVAKEAWTGDGATTKTYSYDAAGNKVGLSDTAKGNLIYSYNPHGDVTQLLTLAGSAQAAYGYRPYGDEEQGTGSISQGDSGTTVTRSTAGALNSYRYSGKRFDTANDSINMGARFFSPDFGSFLQEDYLRDALGDLDLATDPLSGTRYGLAGGNPINFVEIDGHVFGIPCSVCKNVVNYVKEIGIGAKNELVKEARALRDLKQCPAIWESSSRWWSCQKKATSEAVRNFPSDVEAFGEQIKWTVTRAAHGDPQAIGSLGVVVAEAVVLHKVGGRVTVIRRGSLTIDTNGTFSVSELRVARHLAAEGNKVRLRPPTGIGRTSDLLVNGERWDVYTPKTANINRIVSAAAKKGSQVPGGGVIIDLSESPLTRADLGNLRTLRNRIRKTGSRVKYIRVID
jgi:RHS repeat-associated protein